VYIVGRLDSTGLEHMQRNLFTYEDDGLADQVIDD
jgi:hypothetical protein